MARLQGHIKKRGIEKRNHLELVERARDGYGEDLALIFSLLYFFDVGVTLDACLGFVFITLILVLSYCFRHIPIMFTFEPMMMSSSIMN